MRITIAVMMIAATTSVAIANVDGPISVNQGTAKPWFTISNADMVSFDILANAYRPSALSATDTDPTQPGIGWDVPGVNNTEFNFDGFTFGSNTWASGQLGWSMFRGAAQSIWGPPISPVTADDTLPSEFGNLSAYDGFKLSFHNEVFGPVTAGNTQHAVMAALFINTGWTDQGQPDNYYQSDWVWALPCDNLTLELSFAGVQNLGNVSSLGVIIGSNKVIAGQPVPGLWGIPDQTGFKVCLDTVPVPGAAVLGVIGLGLVGWIRRRV